jgi:hypothetical protein
MSSTTWSLTSSARRDSIPASFASLAELRSFLSSHERARADDPDPAAILFGATRNGWCYAAIDKLISEWHVPALSFLTTRSSGQKFDLGLRSYYQFSVLDVPEIDAAIAAIATVFERAESHPDAAAKLIMGFEAVPQNSAEEQVWMRKTILEAVRDDLVSENPSMEIPLAEDGQGPEYLFPFLRTALAILQAAKARGEVVTHFQVIP